MPASSTPAGAPTAPAGRRRALGAFYTPPHVVGYMTSRLARLGTGSRILEPSAGDGAFVVGLLDAGARPAQIDVWDVDAAVGPALADLGVRFTCQDALLDSAPRGQYTHVIGNPPYLNKHSDYIREHRSQLRARYGHVGVNDTYALFIVMALDQLRAGGQLVLLVSDTFLTLGIHRKLRHLLLTQSTLDEVTLLPDATFGDASVRTAVVALTKVAAQPGHQVSFRDLRNLPPGTYPDGNTSLVRHEELLGNPGHVFAFASRDRAVLRVIAQCPDKLVDLLDGGLGLYTRDNRRHLRVVDYADAGTLAPVPHGQSPLPATAVGAGTDARWRFLHKRGGESRWWRPAEHAVAWDERSRAGYGIPATAQAGEGVSTCRPGLVISGVAARMSARVMTPTALWESNKVFGFFPKDPARHPVELLLAVLNSTWYANAARTLNHTVSLQMRDIAALPWLPFTPQEESALTDLGAAAVTHVRAGHHGEPPQQHDIDRIVEAAAARVAGQQT